SGVLAEIRVPAGAVAPVGAVVGVIADGAGAAVSTTASPTENRPPPRAVVPGPRRDTPAPAASAEQGPRAPPDPFFEVPTQERNCGPARLPGGATVTPLARRLASEAGIDLSQLRGSGPRGRIVARDIAAAPQAAGLAPGPLLPGSAAAIKALFEPGSFQEVP